MTETMENSLDRLLKVAENIAPTYTDSYYEESIEQFLYAMQKQGDMDTAAVILSLRHHITSKVWSQAQRTGNVGIANADRSGFERGYAEGYHMGYATAQNKIASPSLNLDLTGFVKLFQD